MPNGNGNSHHQSVWQQVQYIEDEVKVLRSRIAELQEANRSLKHRMKILKKEFKDGNDG